MRRRYAVDVHPKLMEAAQQASRKKSSALVARKATGSTYGVADDQYDSLYLYPVKINGQTVHCMIGSAASDL